MKEIIKDNLQVQIFETRKEMGSAAAKDAAECIKNLIKEKGGIRMIFAAAPSQNEFLEALISDKDIDWSKIDAFHMDENAQFTYAPVIVARKIGKSLELCTKIKFN